MGSNPTGRMGDVRVGAGKGTAGAGSRGTSGLHRAPWRGSCARRKASPGNRDESATETLAPPRDVKLRFAGRVKRATGQGQRCQTAGGRPGRYSRVGSLDRYRHRTKAWVRSIPQHTDVAQRVEQGPYEPQVVGSSPTVRIAGVAQLGSAPVSHTGGRGFDSLHPHSALVV